MNAEIVLPVAADAATRAAPCETRSAQAAEAPVVIIGAGPVGMRVQEQLGRLAPDTPVVVFGDEACLPYNRVRLSSLLAGQVTAGEITHTGGRVGVTHRVARVVDVDREAKVVVDAHGHRQPYSRLVLATGSRPFVPAIPGVELAGVYTFRDMADAEKLAARRIRTRHTVVLGGGLLGLEVARAMQRFRTRVTVVDHNAHVMFRQLDPASGDLLHQALARLGIELLLNTSVRMLTGAGRVQSVVLRDGRELECDTFVVATGIEPAIDLARRAGLAVGRGVRVDDAMTTSDPDIYAAGECCEHEGQVYGIVAPGLEQAAIVAKSLARQPARYRGAMLATSLKVVGLSVFSMGDAAVTDGSTRTYTYRDGDVYRRINVLRGRLTGVIAVGDWPELVRLREHAKQGRRLMPWQLWQFRRHGSLWQDEASAAAWPAEALVCNCNSVSKGEIVAAVAAGCHTVERIGQATRAGTTCGSCRPLLAELTGQGQAVPPQRGGRTLAAASLLALAVTALALVAPSLPYTDTVQLAWRWDLLWTTSLFKQISGYSLLGLAALGAVLSLRKRIPAWQAGDFAWWRLAHVVLGALALGVLAVHTGFRLGDHLNLMLMLVFLGLLVAGAGLGWTVAAEYRLGAARARRLRRIGMWAHLLLCWPLPALLGLHILKTYYF